MAPTAWRGGLVQRDGSTDSGEDGVSMSTGAIVGIACGAGALFLGSLVLFIVYWRKQKRYDEEDNYYPTTDQDASLDSPSTPPVYTLDYKGADATTTESYRSTTPQTSHTTQSGLTPLIEMASAMPTHPAYIPRALVRQNGSGRGTPSTMSPMSGSTSQFSSIHSRQQQPQQTEPEERFTSLGPVPSDRRARQQMHEEYGSDSVADSRDRDYSSHRHRPSAATGTGPGPIPVPVPALVAPTYSSTRRKQYSPPRLNLNVQPPQSKYINTSQPAPMVPSEKVPISAVEISGPLAFPPQPPPPPPPPLQLGGPRQQQEHHQQYQKDLELQLQLEHQQQQEQRYQNNNYYYDESSSAGGAGTGPEGSYYRGGARGRSFRDRSLSSRGGTSRSRSNRGADRSGAGSGTDRYHSSSSSNNNTNNNNNNNGGRQGQQYQHHRWSQQNQPPTHWEEVEIGTKDSDDDIW